METANWRSTAGGCRFCHGNPRTRPVSNLQSTTPSCSISSAFIGVAVIVGLGALHAAAPLHAQAVDPKLEESVGWYTGTAGRIDNTLAKELLLEAAEDGDPISRMWIARVYSRGRMNFERDEAQARTIARDVIDRIESLAEQRIAEAVFLMGTAYDEGLGKTANIETAVQWYRRAADLAHGLARHNLGNVYFEGRGVVQNDSLAVHWWTMAAEGGDAIPQLRLGTMYEEGRGVARNLTEARRWYGLSAARGNADARAALERLGR